MKIPEEQKDEIINGMLEMLDPNATEEIEEIKEIPGRDLINIYEVFKDTKGNLILPGVKYLYSQTETKRINHRQKIGQIIADSANQTEWTEKLGEYLAKYAKDPAAVIKSIPVRVSVLNIKKSDN